VAQNIQTLRAVEPAVVKRVPLVAVKCGERGALVQAASQRWLVPAEYVTPLDTIGAGESFDAGFLAAYTGKQPEDFRRRVAEIAASKGFSESKLILGGDHLGPKPWQKQNAIEVCGRPSGQCGTMSGQGTRRSTSMPAWLVGTITVHSPKRRSPAAPQLFVPPLSSPVASRNPFM